VFRLFWWVVVGRFLFFVEVMKVKVSLRYHYVNFFCCVRRVLWRRWSFKKTSQILTNIKIIHTQQNKTQTFSRLRIFLFRFFSSKFLYSFFVFRRYINYVIINLAILHIYHSLFPNNNSAQKLISCFVSSKFEKNVFRKVIGCICYFVIC